MADSIKEILINKAIDEFLNLVLGRSKEELVELLSKNDLKKILFDVMKKVSEDAYIKAEFKDCVFIDNLGGLDDIDNRLLNPAVPLDELKRNLKAVIDMYFISDYDSSKDVIITMVANKYRTAASLKLRLYDVLVEQEKMYKDVSEKLDYQAEMLSKIFYAQSNEEEYKEDMMKNKMKDILLPKINDIVNRFLVLILKHPAQQVDVYILKSTIDNLEYLVQEDFYKKIIQVLVFDLSKGLSFDMENTEFTFNEYCTKVFKYPSINIINDIISKYANYLTKEFNSSLISLRSGLDSYMFITGIEFNNEFDSNNVVFDVNDLRNALRKVGMDLINLYGCLE